MQAAYIQSQINIQERRLSSLQKDLSTYQNNLQEMKSALAELNPKKKQYENEFKAAYASYPKKIITMDPLGLNGMEKIQAGTENAFSGAKEKSFASGTENNLTSIQKKINSEENRISTCQKNITNTKNTIASLERQLASAVV